MSSKGLSLPSFCSGIELNATTYVVCGIAAFVVWNIVSYAKNSGESKKKEPPKQDERNGGGANGVAVSSEVSSSAPSPLAGCVKIDEHFGNGFVDRDATEPARDRVESKKSTAVKRDGRNGVGAVAKAVATPREGDFKISSLVNGNAGRIQSEPGHDQDVFDELRSSEATLGSVEELIGGPEREGERGSSDGASDETDVNACRTSAESGQRLRARDGAWKDEGPHVVRLLDSGWTEEELDVHQRPIEVYAWFDYHKSCDCSLEFEVILQDKKRRRITDYQHIPASFKTAISVYKKVSLIFQNYGTGIRYVTYTHRRRKSTKGECKGHSVSEMYSGLRKLFKINTLK
ncbi:uncharacterized protein LOC124153828 [Ischnura elegans]|uniref:uncharacterized protein LOC124153828 n=1 Tax=Ischnura elegans TaxID=197161 RepID=UPI001ED89C7E|nr:uncharacterized protein LOC124153828 [Ischnura elegans]